MQQLTMLQNAEYSAIDNLNKFEKFEVRWQKLKKKRVNRQNYLQSTNVVLLLTYRRYISDFLRIKITNK